MNGVGRLRRLLADRQAGISLTELIVAMMVFTLVLTIVSGAFVAFSKTNAVGRATDTNVLQASNGMNELARIIRAGTVRPVSGQSTPDPAFVAASAESLTIYAYVNLAGSSSTPERVQFTVDPTTRALSETVVVGRESPVGSGYWFFDGVSSTRVLASAVAPAASGAACSAQGATPSSSAPLFCYLDAGGAVVPVGAGATASQLPQIASVSITLAIRGSATSRDTAVTLQNTVGIPNLLTGTVVS